MYATLAMGSFLWHGSNSEVGYVLDNRIIDMLIYLMYTTAV